MDAAASRLSSCAKSASGEEEEEEEEGPEEGPEEATTEARRWGTRDARVADDRTPRRSPAASGRAAATGVAESAARARRGIAAR